LLREILREEDLSVGGGVKKKKASEALAFKV
jgi:hypothetical protein